MTIAKLQNGVEMYYEVHGEGESLILINGLKSDHTGWAPMLDMLKDRFQVILLDNRGVGQTKDDGQPFMIKDMADDIILLMNHLGIESAYVAGHSMGGAIAQVLAHDYPEKIRKLFLCNSFVKFNETSREAFSGILGLYQNGASRAEIINAIIPWVFVDTLDTPEFRLQIHTFVESDQLWQSKEDYERQLNAINSFDSSSWVDKISIPTVVIGSHADKTALPEESKNLKEKIQRAELEMLEGGHASAVEQAEAFCELFFNHLCLSHTNRY